MWLDPLLRKIAITAAGVAMPERAKWKFNTGVTLTDDPSNEQMIVDTAGGGGGGGTITNVIAGNGMTGGGLSGAVTLNVVPDDGSIVALSDSIRVGIINDTQHGTRGGGTLHANVTNAAAGFAAAITGAALALLSTGPGTSAAWAKIADTHIDSGAAIAVSKLATSTEGFYLQIVGGIPTWAAGGGGSGDITDVIAGAGMTGGASSGAATLNVIAHTDGSIVVNANDIQVGVINATQHGNQTSGALHAAVSNTSAGFAVSITAGDRALLSNAGGTAATWAQIANAHVSSTAAIAVSKLAAGTDTHVLTTVAGVPTWAAPTGGGAGDIEGVIAGNGLTGGGASGTVTLDVVANVDASIVVNANDIQVAAAIQSGAALGTTSVQPARTVTAGAGLTGGGTLAADRTFDIVAANATITVTADAIAVGEIANANVAAAAAIAVSKLAGGTDTHVLTMVTGVPTWAAPAGGGGGDITDVIAGNGLTGGGTTGSVTLDVVAADTTISVTANAIAVGADSITNTHVNTAAAIAGTKISPNFGAQAVITTSTLSVGASPVASAGDIRLPFGGSVRLRNAANTGNVIAFLLSTSDELFVGSSGAGDRAATLSIDPTTQTNLKIAGTNKVTVTSSLVTIVDNLAMGASPAGAGRIRLTDGDQVKTLSGGRDVLAFYIDDSAGEEFLFLGGVDGSAVDAPDHIRASAVAGVSAYINGTVKLSVTSTLVSVTDSLALGATPATAGRIRLTDADTIQMFTGSRNVTLLTGGSDGSEYVYVGGTTNLPDIVRLTGVTRLQFVLGSELMFVTTTGVTVAGHAIGDLANANTPDFTVALNRTVNFAGGGAAFTQRAASVLAPTYTADVAQTISVLATVAIGADPVASTNVTATRTAALWIEAGGLAFGASFSTTGLLRVAHNTTVLSGRNSGDSANVNLLRWGVAASTLTIGESGSGLSTITYEANAALDWIINGSTVFGITNRYDLYLGNLQWRPTVTAPSIIQEMHSSGAGVAMLMRAQQAAGTNQPGGALNLEGGTPSGTGVGGAVRLKIGASSAVTMVEATEVIDGNYVTALARRADLTSTHMPANSGNGVINIAMAATMPTARPGTNGGVSIACGDSGGSGQNGIGLYFNSAGSSNYFLLTTNAEADAPQHMIVRPGHATGAGGTHSGADVWIIGSDANGASGTRTGGDVLLRAGNSATTPGAVKILSPADAVLLSTSAAGIGFFGSTTTQQTGVAVTATAIHAALVNYGLITA